MKKRITLYLLLAFTCLGLQSCLFQEEDYFDDSSANRATADVKRCTELLKSAPNGWVMEYYVGEHYLLGGFNLYCLFNDEKVIMASQLYEKGQKSISSLYRVLSEQSTMLTFDTYNPLLHIYGEPNGSMSDDPNGNLGGDYEFIIMKASADRIELKGKKYGNRIIMTPLPETISWKKYMGALSDMDEKIYQYTYDLYIDGLYTGTLRRNGYSFEITYYNEIGQSLNKKIPFMLTTEGLRFREALTIDGIVMQNFVWNNEKEELVCKDEGATKAKLLGVNPAGYINYESFIGDYTLDYYTYDDTGKQLVEKVRDVSIIQKEKGKSYLLTGAVDGYSIPVNYDRTNGVITLDAGELLAEENKDYLYLTICDIYTGQLTKTTGIGLFSYVDQSSENLRFAMISNGRWGQASGFFLGMFDSKKENANYITYIGEIIAGPIFTKKEKE